jgi:hypothetical protein
MTSKVTSGTNVFYPEKNLQKNNNKNHNNTSQQPNSLAHDASLKGLPKKKRTFSQVVSPSENTPDTSLSSKQSSHIQGSSKTESNTLPSNPIMPQAKTDPLRGPRPIKQLNFVNLLKKNIYVPTGQNEFLLECPSPANQAGAASILNSKKSIAFTHKGKDYTFPANELELVAKYQNLPQEQKPSYYIVPMLVALQAHKLGLNRKDLLGYKKTKKDNKDRKFVRYDFQAIEIGSTPQESCEKFVKVRNLLSTNVTLGYKKQALNSTRNEDDTFAAYVTIDKETKPFDLEYEEIAGEPIEGYECVTFRYKKINLPAPERGTAFLVPQRVAMAAARNDVFSGDLEIVLKIYGKAMENSFTSLDTFQIPKKSLM